MVNAFPLAVGRRCRLHVLVTHRPLPASQISEMSNVSCVSRAVQGRTRAAESAKQQGTGHTLPVMSTAPDVLAQAAETAAAAVPPHTPALVHDNLEEEGESGYVSGSSSKRHRHKVRPLNVMRSEQLK